MDNRRLVSGQVRGIAIARQSVAARPAVQHHRCGAGTAGQMAAALIWSNRLIYEQQPERIHVLAVLHGRRLLESIGVRFED